MGEAIIAGGGRTNDGSAKMKYKLMTDIITENQIYYPPEAKNQQFHVLLFGGGGGGQTSSIRSGGGGAGGNMNQAILTLGKSSPIQVNIASRSNSAGGTSTFGSYLSATGGESGASWHANGGSAGSSVLVGQGYTITSNLQRAYQFGSGGIGYYGGGAGGCITGSTSGFYDEDYSSYGFNVGCMNAGNGGKYGGGGGSGGRIYCFSGHMVGFDILSKEGVGGRYINNGNTIVAELAGNGGSFMQNGNNGINTIEESSIYRDELNNVYYNGNGIGGIGSDINYLCQTDYGDYFNFSLYLYGAGGGGGGYGGRGGNSMYIHNAMSTKNAYRYFGGAGGGGGGYGSNGADGSVSYNGLWGYIWTAIGGAGGGYGGDAGKTIFTRVTNYTVDGAFGGGGGGYGPGGKGGTYTINNGNGGIAAGGSAGYYEPKNCPNFAGLGGPGICIIQYYQLVMD